MASNPRRMTLVVLAATLCAASFLNYWQYSKDFYMPGFATYPAGWMAVIKGTAYAPEQYRVGVVQTAYWLSQHLHMGIRHALGLLDAISVLVAAFLLYGLLERSAIYRNATLAVKWFGSAAFVLLVQFYMAWLLWYQRPETLPMTMLVALLLWLWTRKKIWLDESVLGRLITGCLIILITLAQALVRADVAFMLNVGVFIGCLTRFGKGLALPRSAATLSSLMGVVLAGSVQLYMMKVAYPLTTYGGTSPFALKLNIFTPHRWPPFVLFILPFVWLLVQIARHRFTGNAANLAFTVGGLLFAGVWVVIGKIDEVRIFLPFAIVLVPLTVQMAMQRLDGV